MIITYYVKLLSLSSLFIKGCYFLSLHVRICIAYKKVGHLDVVACITIVVSTIVLCSVIIVHLLVANLLVQIRFYNIWHNFIKIENLFYCNVVFQALKVSCISNYAILRLEARASEAIYVFVHIPMTIELHTFNYTAIIYRCFILQS